MTAYRLVAGCYWLFLGTWFGALVMLVIAAGITFATVRSYQPTLRAEPYARLTDAEPDRVLAGGIVGNVLRGLAVVQVICALALGACLLLQCTILRPHLAVPVGDWRNCLRIALIALPTLVLILDLTVVSPRIWRLREVMYDPDQPSAARTTAHAAFGRYHKASERLTGAAALCLAGAVLASAFVLHAAPGATAAAPPAARTHDG